MRRLRTYWVACGVWRVDEVSQRGDVRRGMRTG